MYLLNTYNFNLIYYRRKQIENSKLLSDLNYKKEKLKNNLINDYLKNKGNPAILINVNSSKLPNYKYEISNKINAILDSKYSSIETEFNNLKEKSCGRLYEDYLSKLNSSEIKFNTNLLLFQKLVYSLSPYISQDQNTTQEVFDNISDLTEKLYKFHVKILENQTYLRKRLNQTQVKDKITIDERDGINLSLCNLLKKEYMDKNNNIKSEFAYNNENKDLILELKDLDNYYQCFESNVENLERNSKRFVVDFFSELYEKIKIQYKILNKMKIIREGEGGNNNSNDNKISKSEVVTSLLKLKEESYTIFKEILTTFYEDRLYNERLSLDITDILFLHVFQPHLYAKIVGGK